jgi:DNA-binding response OmpR family regulator
MVVMLLKREGFEVMAVDDGASALELVRERPDLILLDYMMPRLSAPGFLDARKHHPLLRDSRVVVISAYPELAEIVLAETVGVVHKPMDLEILLECVHYHCSRAAAESVSAAPSLGHVT